MNPEPLKGWLLLRTRLRFFFYRLWWQFGIRVITQKCFARSKCDLANCRGQLLALCVLDLGYVKAPVYGHAPLRHQFAWDFAVDGMKPETVQHEVSRMMMKRADR